MSARCLITAVAILVGLAGCATTTSSITEYLSGFQPPPAETQPVALPLVAGLIMVLPEDELGKPTTPSQEMLEQVALRLRQELQGAPNIEIRRIFPSLAIPAAGRHVNSRRRGQRSRRAVPVTTATTTTAATTRSSTPPTISSSSGPKRIIFARLPSPASRGRSPCPFRWLPGAPVRPVAVL